MMCLSSSWTICRGVSADDMWLPGLPALGRVQLLDAEAAVGVDTDVGGDVEGALHDLARAQGRPVEQRPGGGERVLSARADRRDVVIGLDHVAVARDDEELLRIAHQQQRLEPAQVAVRAPVLGELDGGARQVAVLLELALEALEERKGVRGSAGEA